MAEAAQTESALEIGGAAGSAEPGGSAGPPTEADDLDDLGDEIARLAAHIHAANRRYRELVAELDRRRGTDGRFS